MERTMEYKCLKSEKEKKMQIARTIMMQLGGRKFTVMTGAKDYMAIDDGLTFRIPGTMTKKHINKVRIILDPSDTYTVTFHKIQKVRGKFVGGYDCKQIAEHSMVYDDMLQDIFTAETGLDTHL